MPDITKPAIAMPLLVDFNPKIPKTIPVIEMGNPHIGKNHAHKLNIPNTIEAIPNPGLVDLTGSVAYGEGEP
jgi:hypothetical protein